ncbi:hypothetical protein [Nitrosomonas europaea]|nr:hypothetical protein [Nitrosomonas europaea]KXK36347.1 MAG: hypothetical protein UZ02_AOB001002416 [Nitrosomonas europaea]MBV6388953.1 hypothetical protein [Nitrosomonas europaea]HNS57455.1 hypothetical protein [Nitrosomonas europaea]
MHVKEPGSESITLVILIFLISDLTPTMFVRDITLIVVPARHYQKLPDFDEQLGSVAGGNPVSLLPLLLDCFTLRVRNDMVFSQTLK